MFEITNYIFLNQYSKVSYQKSKGIHLFIQSGILPRLRFGKNGTLFLKNRRDCVKIIYIKITVKGISKSHVQLNPKSLVVDKKNNIDLSFQNSLSKSENKRVLSRINLNPANNFIKVSPKSIKKLKFIVGLNSIKNSKRFKIRNLMIKVNS